MACFGSTAAPVEATLNNSIENQLSFEGWALRTKARAAYADDGGLLGKPKEVQCVISPGFLLLLGAKLGGSITPSHANGEAHGLIGCSAQFLPHGPAFEGGEGLGPCVELSSPWWPEERVLLIAAQRSAGGQTEGGSPAASASGWGWKSSKTSAWEDALPVVPFHEVVDALVRAVAQCPQLDVLTRAILPTGSLRGLLCGEAQAAHAPGQEGILNPWRNVRLRAGSVGRALLLSLQPAWSHGSYAHAVPGKSGLTVAIDASTEVKVQAAQGQGTGKRPQRPGTEPDGAGGGNVSLQLGSVVLRGTVLRRGHSWLLPTGTRHQGELRLMPWDDRLGLRPTPLRRVPRADDFDDYDPDDDPAEQACGKGMELGDWYRKSDDRGEDDEDEDGDGSPRKATGRAGVIGGQRPQAAGGAAEPVNSVGKASTTAKLPPLPERPIQPAARPAKVKAPQQAPATSPMPADLWTRLDKMSLLAQCVVPLPLSSFESSYFSDQAVFSTGDAHRTRGDKDVVQGPWVRDGNNNVMSRSLKLVMPLPAGVPMMPSQTRVDKDERLARHAWPQAGESQGQVLILSTTAKSLDVPFGDCFVTEQVMLVVPAGVEFPLSNKTLAKPPQEDVEAARQLATEVGSGASLEASQYSRVLLFATVTFHKSTMFKSKISTETEKSMRAFGAEYMRQVKAQVGRAVQAQQQQGEEEEGGEVHGHNEHDEAAHNHGTTEASSSAGPDAGEDDVLGKAMEDTTATGYKSASRGTSSRAVAKQEQPALSDAWTSAAERWWGPERRLFLSLQRLLLLQRGLWARHLSTMAAVIQKQWRAARARQGKREARRVKRLEKLAGKLADRGQAVGRVVDRAGRLVALDLGPSPFTQGSAGSAIPPLALSRAFDPEASQGDSWAVHVEVVSLPSSSTPAMDLSVVLLVPGLTQPEADPGLGHAWGGLLRLVDLDKVAVLRVRWPGERWADEGLRQALLELEGQGEQVHGLSHASLGRVHTAAALTGQRGLTILPNVVGSAAFKRTWTEAGPAGLATAALVRLLQGVCAAEGHRTLRKALFGEGTRAPPVVLVGHSMGARLVLSALACIGTEATAYGGLGGSEDEDAVPHGVPQSAILLGSLAAGPEDAGLQWSAASRGVTRALVNVWSSHDLVAGRCLGGGSRGVLASRLGLDTLGLHAPSAGVRPVAPACHRAAPGVLLDVDASPLLARGSMSTVVGLMGGHNYADVAASVIRAALPDVMPLKA